MSLMDDVKAYYAARAPVYDETAGYNDQEAEKMRPPIKARYRRIFRGRKVLEIACGTGYWTKAIADVAESILAVDIDAGMISLAQNRCKQLSNVKFQIADVYDLSEIPLTFNAAFATGWWSHIPKNRISDFLSTLHSKLEPEALVLFTDQMPYNGFVRAQDADGNILEQRVLPDCSRFMIVKNFPTQQDIMGYLKDIADDIRYTEFPKDWWSVLYKKK